MINHRLRKHVNRYNFLEEHQENFRSRRGTVRSLYPQHLEPGKLKNNHSSALVNIDLEKLFDNIWTNGPPYKLKSYNVIGNLLKLIETLIINKKLTYKNHLANAFSKEQKSWKSIHGKCSKQWALTINTQTLLFKTLNQPQVIFPSPV